MATPSTEKEALCFSTHYKAIEKRKCAVYVTVIPPSFSGIRPRSCRMVRNYFSRTNLLLN